MNIDTCPICYVRCRPMGIGHKCNPRRLAAIDAAHRRATDDDLPDEPSADDKLAEWDERMRSLSDDYCPAEHPYPPISTRRPREERR